MTWISDNTWNLWVEWIKVKKKREKPGQQTIVSRADYFTGNIEDKTT